MVELPPNPGRLQPWTGLLLAVALVAEASSGQAGGVWLAVEDLQGRPVEGVVLAAKGPGGRSAATTGEGKTWLPVAGAAAGRSVAIELVPGGEGTPDWVLIDPWNERVRVPEAGPEAFEQLVVGRWSERDLLRDGRALQSITARIMEEAQRAVRAGEEVSASQRQAVLEAQAKRYGLSALEVDEAIRAWETDDLLDEGLKALYAEAYPEATAALTKSLLQQEEAIEKAEERYADTAFFLGTSLYQQGRYRESVEARQKALERRPDDARLLNGLGLSLLAAGEARQAREALGRAVELSWEERGAEHPDTLSAMNNLALILRALGDLPGARALQETALSGLRRVLGEEHPHTLISMGSLAATLGDLGDLPAARRLEESVLSVFKRLLGEEHTDTLTSMNNLALTLHAQGDLAGARSLQETVLSVSRRVQGDEHPYTLTAMNNLAGTLLAEGDLAGGGELLAAVLSICRRVQGEEHPDTLTVMNNLSAVLYAEGDLQGARALQETVLSIRKRVLGKEHFDTLTAMSNLALTLHSQRDLWGAREIQETVLSIRRRLLGEEHPDTLAAMHSLASTLTSQGDLLAARELQKRVLLASRQVLGDEHQHTLAAMHNLASIKKAEGDLPAARELLETSVSVSRRVLGERHPDTAIAAWNLYRVLVELSANEDAAIVKQRLEWLLKADPEELPRDLAVIRGELGELPDR